MAYKLHILGGIVKGEVGTHNTNVRPSLILSQNPPTNHPQIVASNANW